ncbi:MAG: hypothetical protein Q8K30_01170 [Candidatus Gracilibacteria bacterium]|nr:hypothetical protein [Candidatus Gracilibacteria bacterium]
MKNAYIQKLTKNSGLIFGIILLFGLFFSSNLPAIAGILGYGSDSDYNNPNTTLSGSVQVGTGETLTGAVVFTFTNAVQFSSGSITAIVPLNTQITNSNGTSFDVTSVGASNLNTLPLSINTNEEDVGKVKFGINGMKLNFSKPVKLLIPVNTNKTSVRIKVKHFGNTTYQTSSLTDIVASSCNNGIANPSSNIAPVVNGFAIIYTCSASEFVALTDKNIVVSSGGSGGGGGGYKILVKDSCPNGDFSKSYYDKDCGNATIISNVNSNNTSSINNNSGTLVNSTGSSINEELILKDTKKRIVNYKGMNIIVIDGYKLSTKTAIITKKIIENNKMSLSEKQNFINRVNEFLVSKYNLDIVEKKSITLKNQYIRQYFLLKMTIKNLER